jgi:hypothetical protein
MIKEFKIEGKDKMSFSVQEADRPEEIVVKIYDHGQAIGTVELGRKDWEDLVSVTRGVSSNYFLWSGNANNVA